MATNVIMPALGVAQQTGTLLKWLKSEGQNVSKGEPLMEIETDKATVEIEAPASGILSQVTAKPGDVIPVGNPIAIILAPGETAGALAASVHPKPLQKKERKDRESPAADRVKAATPTSRGEGISGGQLSVARLQPSIEVAPGFASNRRVLASPAAKRIARERNIDLASLSGSGPGGSILIRDVQGAVPAEGQKQITVHEENIQPLSLMRRIIAERMTRSKQTAPHFYLNVEIEMSSVNRQRADWKAHNETPAPSINDFILYACARALTEFPSLNASFSDRGIRIHDDINLGMAVALEEGLVVPVIRNADLLGLTELAAQSRELAAKAQNKKLLPADYENGTFTVSNLGMLGVDSFVAIINPPQAGILAVGRIGERVVAEDGMFAIRSMMSVTMSADHRIVDGALAARFLQRLKELLESPTP